MDRDASRLDDRVAAVMAAAIGPEAAATGAQRLAITGPADVLPSCFDVTALATGAVAAAAVAAAGLWAARRGVPVPGVRVDSRDACAAFRAEVLFSPLGWERAGLWDPIAGNYRTADGWIRLHTNYPHHRAAVERVLGCTTPEQVQAAVGLRAGAELEAAIDEAGGCSAMLRSHDEWLRTEAGRATRDAPAVSAEPAGHAPTAAPAGEPGWLRVRPEQPFSGVRVLDLTRVLAGPGCTKFLAGFGADVLRIDPPGFPEVGSLLPDTTVGKHTAALDLTDAADRAEFEQLLATADVLVSGYRAGALDRLGYADAALAAINPGLVVATLNAYGVEGPWRARRGFDSLVQLATGIAADGMAWAGRDDPTPLPCQALDHATGFLLAAAVGRALARQATDGGTDRIRASLVGSANLLRSLGAPGSATAEAAGPRLVDTMTAWGPARRVPMPAAIEGASAAWTVEAGPLGRHPAGWASPR